MHDASFATDSFESIFFNKYKEERSTELIPKINYKVVQKRGWSWSAPAQHSNLHLARIPDSKNAIETQSEANQTAV